MKNIIKNIALACCIGLTAVVSSCSDPDDEIKSSVFDRLFSPTDVKATVKNKTNVNVSWEEVKGASSYTIELYANESDMLSNSTPSVSPTASYDNIVDNPYLITGLSGETVYTLRIKAVGENIPESKWTVATFETDAEQIFEAVTDDDITSSSVTLRWAPGSAATAIVVSGGKEATHTLTSAELAAGTATITDLDFETKYTFNIMNGDKSRGKVTVTTMPDYIPAYPGDDLQAMIDAAEEGETIMLLPAKDGSSNEFIYVSSETGEVYTKELTLTKNLSIKCLGTQPVKAQIKFVLTEGVSGFTLENITFVGVTTDVLIKTDNCAGTILVNGIEASGFGNFVVDPGTTDCKVDEFTVTNSYFHDMCSGKRFVDSQKKKCAIMLFNMKNCTVANSCAGSDFLRFDYNANQEGLVVNFENNTLYNIGATSKGLFYIRSNKAGDQAFTCNIKNNVFAEMASGVFFTQDAKTDNLVFSNNNYFNTPTLLANSEGGAGKVFDTTGSSEDPKFKDAAGGDFTITNETLIEKNIGNIR